MLALFEPIAERTFHETLRGRVIVAVDVSESMTTADPTRSSDTKAKLAKVLGLATGDAVAGLSRREVARRLIDGPASVLARLEAEHVVETFTFARQTEPAGPKAVAESLKAPTRPGDPALSETNWDQALERALESGSKAAPCIGVVLLSDGQRNSPVDPMPTVDRLAAHGVPVYSVLIGSTAPPLDAAIAAVKAPESVYRGDVATVRGDDQGRRLRWQRRGCDFGTPRRLTAAKDRAGTGFSERSSTGRFVFGRARRRGHLAAFDRRRAAGR